MLLSDGNEISGIHPSRSPDDVMRAVQITVAVGLTLIAGAIAIAVSLAPLEVARTSSSPANAKLGFSYGPATVCQEDETLPAHTSAIRLLIHSPLIGPQVTLAVLAGERVLVGGTRGSGWTAGAVAVPVRPLPHPVSGVSLCFAVARSPWLVGLTGRRTLPSAAARFDGRAMTGRIGVEYLRQGRRSWWSRALPIATEMGLGHAIGGPLLPLLVLALMLSLAGLSSLLILRELR
jgi:hypothetical protein